MVAEYFCTNQASFSFMTHCCSSFLQNKTEKPDSLSSANPEILRFAFVVSSESVPDEFGRRSFGRGSAKRDASRLAPMYPRRPTSPASGSEICRSAPPSRPRATGAHARATCGDSWCQVCCSRPPGPFWPKEAAGCERLRHRFSRPLAGWLTSSGVVSHVRYSNTGLGGWGAADPRECVS